MTPILFVRFTFCHMTTVMLDTQRQNARTFSERINLRYTTEHDSKLSRYHIQNNCSMCPPFIIIRVVFDYRYRYRYRDISTYRIISISTPVISKLSIWRRTIQPAVRLDERVSRWFNLTGGPQRVNYLARQRTAGSRGRQSPIVGGAWGVAYYWRVNLGCETETYSV